MGEAQAARAHRNTRRRRADDARRIGIPGRLTLQTWQLKELREKGAIDFYETRPRE